MRQEKIKADVLRLKENLGQLPEPMVNPPFIVVSGLPGTGKSYFSRRLSEKMPLAVLESDSLRKQLFSSPQYTPQESARLFQACHSLIEELLKEGVPLVLDATNLEELHRERLYYIADKLGIKLIIVRTEAPTEVVYQRLEQRRFDPEGSSDADWRVYEKMKPNDQQIRRNHFRVDTSKDISPVIDKIVREANR
jgi:predicted kinase